MIAADPVMTPPPPRVERVLLVGNYRRDGQESMLRFAQMLRDGLEARRIAAVMIAPAVILGRWLPTWSGPGKWLAYIDKYLLFPLQLRWRARGLPADVLVHICDHSNAVYVPAAASTGHRVLVTCHDLGAVRGALGEATDCPATSTGKILQKWIARSLGLADLIACDSTATRRDVDRLIRRPDGTPVNSRLVLIGLNAPYHALDDAEAGARLREIPDFALEVPFVLNVGSSLRRKNRAGVLRIFAQTLTACPALRLVFAGEALTPDLAGLMHELGIADHEKQVVAPSNALLEALYSRALALLFPSRFEGFGWPVIEAQACGCPVLCSDAGSLEEVAGQGGFVRAPDAEADFAGELARLASDPAARAEWGRRGRENVRRFTADAMIGRYIDLYDELLEAGAAPAARTVAAHRA
jgi:glycosyltransferase involved in cell wall biosynthesis